MNSDLVSAVASGEYVVSSEGKLIPYPKKLRKELEEMGNERVDEFLMSGTWEKLPLSSSASKAAIGVISGVGGATAGIFSTTFLTGTASVATTTATGSTIAGFLASVLGA